MVLEKTFESPLDNKEIQPVYPRGNQSWTFTVRIDAEAPILWPHDAKVWLIRKDPDAGKDCRQEEKGTIEDEMVGWHHWLSGRKCEQAPGDYDGQGSLGVTKSRTWLSDWTTTKTLRTYVKKKKKLTNSFSWICILIIYYTLYYRKIMGNHGTAVFSN